MKKPIPQESIEYDYQQFTYFSFKTYKVYYKRASRKSNKYVHCYNCIIGQII